MNILQQIETAFNHPAFRLAIQSVKQGDESDLKHLFFEIMFHTYEKSTLNASRKYGANRWMEQTCKILEEVRNTPPPENLDLRLKIPSKRLFLKEPKTETPPIVRKTIHMRRIILENPNQLTIVFQQTA